MSTMNISLPPKLREFVEQQVESGRYSTASEYVRELIRSDEKRRAQEKLEAMLLEGVHSGEPTELTDQDWRDIREEGRRILTERRARRAS